MTQPSRMDFFLRIEPEPPRVTHQMKKIGVRNGKPYTYEEPRLKNARALLTSLLMRHRPKKPMTGPLLLETSWFFKGDGKTDVELMTTRPDADNLNKLLQDCMTKCGFFNDDSQVIPYVVRFKVNPKGVHGIQVKLAKVVMTDEDRSRIKQMLELCKAAEEE